MRSNQTSATSLAPYPESPPPWRQPIRRILRNWRERHRHPFNFWIHLIGIPLALVGLALLIAQEWYWGTAGLVVGYLLQFVGHRAEGNDVGEWAAVKRLFGLPYVSISPRWRAAEEGEAASRA